MKKSYPDNTTESFTYDAKGNILTATNGNISYTFTYNTNGKIISATDTSGRTLNYQYDNLGNKTKLTYPEGSVVNYSYDTANRLSSIVNGGGRTYSYLYDSLGRRSKLTYPNGVQTSYVYDTTGRLTNLLTRNSKLETLNTFTYTHDKVGNRLTRATPGNTATYNYDKDYRVTAATYTNSGPTKLQNESYSYDPVGNRLTSSPNRTYTYNQGNQLTNYKGKAYIYDKNGNLIIKTDEDYDLDLEIEGWIYSYDYENRLTKVQKKENNETKTITFKYDPFGRRIEKRIESIDKGVTETSLQTYVYDNEDIILEYRTKTTNGATTTEIIKYVHGPSIDEPIAMTDSTGTYYYHADGLGSITAMTDETGKIVQAYEYDSFGNVHDNMNAIKQPYTYTGREWDKEAGLYFYRARFYDPVVERFISKDPIGFKGGDVNLYNYVRGNPLLFTDPYGEKILVFTRSLDMKVSSGNFVHCVLIVEDCDGSRQTWDFQNTNQVFNPAKPTVYPVKNPKTTVVYAKDDKNDVVSSFANGMAHPDYDITGYNCCGWVESVLSKSGISWKNPNPWPFN